jgi:hypothetical protein
MVFWLENCRALENEFLLTELETIISLFLLDPANPIASRIL